jgi:hypothetical protein
MSAGPKSEFGRYVVPQSRYDMRFFWIGNTVMIRVAQQLLHNGRTNLLANPPHLWKQQPPQPGFGTQHTELSAPKQVFPIETPASARRTGTTDRPALPGPRV